MKGRQLLKGKNADAAGNYLQTGQYWQDTQLRWKPPKVSETVVQSQACQSAALKYQLGDIANCSEMQLLNTMLSSVLFEQMDSPDAEDFVRGQL